MTHRTLPPVSPASPVAAATRLIREFIRTEASAGILLMVAAVLALVVANSPLAPAYFATKGSYVGPLTVDYWINDGLMAVFFLLVGLEVKREVLVGELSSWQRRILPGVAALAGIAVPAALYIAVASATPGALAGWAIPAATDIAFALGVLALLGSRAPLSLKIFLTAVAVIDDIVAVAIIALFYTAEVAVLPLTLAAVGIGALLAMNRAGVRTLLPYLAVGVLVWIAVLNSGVHATLAGVAVAMTVPVGGARVGGDESENGPLERLEHLLHPVVAYGVLPVFGFANAGIAFGGVSPAIVLTPIPLGIAAGLFAGKQLGIMAACALVIKAGWAQMPAGAGWRHLYGVALLCGIGFTMSLFIGGLAFADPETQDAVKIGVLAGSVLSALAGYLLLAGAGAGREGDDPSAVAH